MSSPNNIKVEYVKPLLKWVGGKTQILEKVMTLFPSEINNYYEPFTGGGSVLLGILSLIEKNKIKVNGNIYASDANKDLISFYKQIVKTPKLFCRELDNLIKEYNKKSDDNEQDDSKEKFYYKMREKYNTGELSDVEKTTLFFFLNKTCFRGVYRIGPNGFNVPFGHYKNVSFYDKAHFTKVVELLKSVTFIHSDFKDILKNVTENDFVYLDPPYVPEKKTSFVKYTKDSFNEQDHKALFELCKNFKKNNIKLLMSNSDVEMVRNSFNKDGFTIESILCKRTINSKNPSSKTNEVLIYFS
jgi:DNA adenine methylase